MQARFRAPWLLTCSILLCASTAPGARAQAPCEFDAALDGAARQLLQAGQAIPDAAVVAAVRAAGSELVRVKGLLWEAESEAPAADWLAQQRERSDAPLVCGRASDGPRRLWLAAPRAAQLAWTREGRLQGRLHDGFSDPWLVVETRDGSLLASAVSTDALRQGVEVQTEATGVKRVQLVARGPNGPRPVADRWGPTAVLPQAEPLVVSQEFVDLSGEPSQAVWQALLRERAATARGPRERRRDRLRLNRLLQNTADTHAQAVCREGRVVHVLTAGKGPQERLTQAGLSARHLGEAVARGRDVAGAWHALLRSPSHRITLLDARFTDAGVGVATDPQARTCLVILLASWPRPTVAR